MNFEITRLRLLRMSHDRGGIKALAERIGMSPNTLSLVERGNMCCPEKWQAAIATFFNVQTNELFDRRGFAVLDPRFSSAEVIPHAWYPEAPGSRKGL